MSNSIKNYNGFQLLRYLGIIAMVLTPVVLFLLYQNSVYKNSYQDQIYAKLANDANQLTHNFDIQVVQLISELEHLSWISEQKMVINKSIANLKKRMPSVLHASFFTADGMLKYSSYRAKYEWQSNLLNLTWYRQLIREWKPVLSDIHQSPISPFPKVLALAVPTQQDQRIDGFWLLYLDINSLKNVLPRSLEEQQGIITVWFDINGELLHFVSNIPEQISAETIKKQNWWYSINETDAQSGKLTMPGSEEELLYACSESTFGTLKSLLVVAKKTALTGYSDYGESVWFKSVIFVLLLAVLVAAVIFSWHKRTSEISSLNSQSSELQNLNQLLESKTVDLMDTNQKLNMLTSELQAQKENLLGLNNQLNRLQKYLNFLTVPVITLNKNARIEFLNRAAEILCDTSVEKAQNKKFDEILRLQDSAKVLDFLKRVGSNQYREELEISVKDGEKVLNFLLVSDYLKLADWEGFVLTLVELTDLINLQQSITQKNEFLDTASQLSHEFLQQRSYDKIMTDSCNFFKDFLQADAVCYYSAEDQELQLHAIFPGKKKLPKTLSRDSSIAARTLVDGNPTFVSDRLNLPKNVDSIEKSWNFNSAYFSPVMLDGNGVGVLIAINPSENRLSDFSNLLIHFEIGLTALQTREQLKIKNAELEQSSNLRAQLLRTTTHGLNTPLGTVRGYTQLIRLKFEGILKKYPELMEFVEKLDTATEEMAAKTRMFLDLARLNRNQLTLKEKTVSVNEFVDPVVKSLKYQSEARSIRFSADLKTKESRQLKIDRDRFVFALRTIFQNALHYAPENKKVEFDVEVQSREIKFRMTDHGPQIKKEHIPLMESEFLPPELEKERIYNGNGLAVSLAVRLIRQIGGQLLIESDKKQTIHTVLLPMIWKEHNEKAA